VAVPPISLDLKRGISADVLLRSKCEHSYIETNPTKKEEGMTTSTVPQSREFSLKQIINQDCNFEEALHSALEEVGERFGLYDIIVQDGPITAPCLATQVGIPVRAARAWLDARPPATA
jgi:hypothetical protein